MKKRILALLLVAALCLSALVACGKKTPTSVAVKIGDCEVTREELLFYYAYYESIGVVYGLNDHSTVEGFWNDKNDEGVTYREYFYTTVFAELSYMVIMSNLATKEGVTLTASEIASVDSDAESFYNDFTDAEKKKSGITLDGFKIALERQMLVGKYETILQSKMEVDEDGIKANYKKADYPAKKTDYIGISLTNSKGEALTGDELATAESNIKLAEEKLKAGSTIEEIVKEYEGSISFFSGTRYLCKASNFSEEYIKATENLANNEISEIITAENRYFIAVMVDVDSPDYYDYIVSDAIQTELDKQMSEYYEKIAVSYTRTIVDKIISSDEFGTYVIDPKNI